MSIENIQLRKLLKIFYLPESKRKSALREDIRAEISKEHGDEASGGDFHAPFWADCKNHVTGSVELREQTKVRIADHKGRERLYPSLTDGFLKWWNEKRRWQNEAFESISENVSSELTFPEVGGTVKVGNLLALKIRNESNRIIYPYFSEEPSLTEEGGRLGLWLLNEAIAPYDIEDMRILDVLRSTSFATIDYPMQGNEREIFVGRYDQVLSEWKELRKEYG